MNIPGSRRVIFLLGWLVMLLPTETTSSLGPAFHFPPGRASLEGGVLGVKMGSQVRPLDSDTLNEIRRVIAYNPDTGEFTWRIRKRGFRGGIIPGAIAGSISASTGYRYIRVGQRGFAAHRIAVLMHNPDADQDLHVDHINGDRADNRLVNLRLVTRAENMQNITAPPRGKSSRYDGVCFCKQTGRWMTAIRMNGTQKHLGRFGTEEEAHAVYVAAKRQYHKTNTRYNSQKEGPK